MHFSKLQISKNDNDPNSKVSLNKWNHLSHTRRSRQKQGGLGGKRSLEGGFATLGAALLLITFLVSMGAVSVLHQIRSRMKKQIELDQLTGSIVIQLRASVITIEQSIERLRIAKGVMIAGCAYLPNCPAFTRAFQLQKKIEDRIQKLAEKNWDAQNMRVFPLKIISINEIQQSNQLTIKIKSEKLISTSKLWKTHGIQNNVWKIAWIE